MIRPIRQMRLIGLIGLISLIGPIFASAQTAPNPPMLILTWQAHAFTPPGYQGKTLPPRGDTVDLHLEFIDGNKIVSLSNNEIRWSVNGQFLASGKGLTKTAFVLDQFTARTYRIRVIVKDYKDKDIEKTIDIKRTDPLAVIETPQGGLSLTGSQVTLTATPYFFLANALSDFVFAWYVSSVGVPHNANRITLDLRRADNNQTITAGVVISNTVNNLETAYGSETFTVKK